MTEVFEDYVAYDLLSLVGEVGGATGLLLGWSCLGVAASAVRALLDRCAGGGRGWGGRREDGRKPTAGREARYQGE